MKKKPSPEESGQNSYRKLIIMGAIVCGALLLTIIIIVAAMFGKLGGASDSEHKQGALGGLLNGELMTDPERVTKEDVESEYQARPEITMDTQKMIDASLLSYLSRGDFSGLDTFLAAQEASVKNAEGDHAQAIEDWEGKFSMLRSDLIAVTNLNANNADQTFISFSDPAILAAAIAYSPISVKVDAFLDWSSVIFPAVPSHSAMLVNMELVTLENPSEQLAALNKNTDTKYTDLVSYDMTLFGYRCRFTAVGDAYGYFRPYTLTNIDGHLIDPLTKSSISKIANALDPHHKLDDVVTVAPFNQAAFDQMKIDFPDWFDADGNYIAGTRVPPSDIETAGT